MPVGANGCLALPASCVVLRKPCFFSGPSVVCATQFGGRRRKTGARRAPGTRSRRHSRRNRKESQVNTQPVSTPTFPGAPRRFGANPVVFVLGGVVLLGGLVAFGLYTSNSGDTASSTASQVEVARPPSTAYFTDSVDRRAWTHYVVGTDEQAMTVRGGLSESDAVRDALGEPVLLESVYVAGSDAEAAAFAAAVTEGNLTLAALGLGEDRVVDVRGG